MRTPEDAARAALEQALDAARVTTDEVRAVAHVIQGVLDGRQTPGTAELEFSDGIPTVREVSTDEAGSAPTLDETQGYDLEEALVGFDLSPASALFLDELRETASRASAGPWRREGDQVVRVRDGAALGHHEPVARLVAVTPEQREHDAQFLATFDPSMVLALLFLNRQLELENARLRRVEEQSARRRDERAWLEEMAPAADLAFGDARSRGGAASSRPVWAAAEATVLVVDERGALRRFVESVLVRGGYEVVAVASADDPDARAALAGASLRVLVGSATGVATVVAPRGASAARPLRRLRIGAGTTPPDLDVFELPRAFTAGELLERLHVLH